MEAIKFLQVNFKIAIKERRKRDIMALNCYFFHLTDCFPPCRNKSIANSEFINYAW